LIFSILKTGDSFCVLDEVDAALDEANVGRFRDALKALGNQTQFILITHNRGNDRGGPTTLRRVDGRLTTPPPLSR